MRGISPNWLLGTETLHLYIRRRWYDMSTYETLSWMIAFGILVVMIIGAKNSHPPTKANVTIFLS
ncbi:putative holin-like toxin [Enterocloster aldenensis]|uniref:putative holin-like toxin n=1 Tax=Enterocloster aldenensis TaxID=358742 RepID=UPI00402850C9